MLYVKYTPRFGNFREQVKKSGFFFGIFNFLIFGFFLIFFGNLRVMISKVGHKLSRWMGYIDRKQCTSLFEDGVFPFGFLLHQAISEKGAECVFPGLLCI